MDTQLADTLTAWRRHLHAHPELTLHERETAAFVQNRLAELGVPFVAGVGGHGVVATISRGSSNRSVGLRADMDALPITETTDVPYASTNPGVMHACGHDGHTTSLLGAAALLARDPTWAGTVQLVFQPAEEGGGGAKSHDRRWPVRAVPDGAHLRLPQLAWPRRGHGCGARRPGDGGRKPGHSDHHRPFRPCRAAAHDARPDGCRGAPAAGAAVDRLTQCRSAGRARLSPWPRSRPAARRTRSPARQ